MPTLRLLFLLPFSLVSCPLMALAAPPMLPSAPRPCIKDMRDLLPSTAETDGQPCCYRQDGRAYSSVYENGVCKADTSLACFLPEPLRAPRLDTEEPRLDA